MQLYKFFKQARDEQPAQPSFYQMEVCVCLSADLAEDVYADWVVHHLQAKYKYNAWKEISHISAQKAQGRYIELVNALVDKYGTKTA